MSKHQDIDRLTRAIRDCEDRLRVFKSNLNTIDSEILQLNTIESQLEENIAFLRKKHIIALAKEYKAVKDDMARTKARLSMLRIDRSNIDRANTDIQSALDKMKTDLAKTLSEPNNVVYGIFRRKNGQE